MVAQAYAKDSVIFIFGVLALAAAISKTGLDRRIGMLLLGTSTSLRRFAFIFAPLLAVTASFLSEHALVAFIAPILMMVYVGRDPLGRPEEGQRAGGRALCSCSPSAPIWAVRARRPREAATR